MDYMQYKDKKDSGIDYFEKLRNLCERSYILSQSVKHCWENIELLEATEDYYDYDQNALNHLWGSFHTVFAESGSITDMMKSCDDSRAAVIIGISKVHQGGGVLRGEMTCEAELCRHSTLYFCLQEKRIQEEFYGLGRECGNDVHKVNCVYLPGVMFFTDRELTERTDGMFADVYVTDIPDIINSEMSAYEDEECKRIISLKLYKIMKDAKARGINTLFICDEQKDVFLR